MAIRPVLFVIPLALPLALGACGGGAAGVGPGDKQPVVDKKPVDTSPKQPVAERRPVETTFHGVTISDPYQWLEGSGEEVERWSDAQDAYTRTVLDALPDLAAMREEVRAIVEAPITRYGEPTPAGGKLFAMRRTPDREQPVLVVMDTPEDAATAKVVLDPGLTFGKLTTIDWFVPSPDGTRVALSLSEGGSEAGTLHVYDLEGAEVDNPIEDVQRGTAGGDLAWRRDGKGFWYTRYPGDTRPEEDRDFYVQLYYHELGTPSADDRHELGKDFPKIAEILVESDSRTDRVIASVQNGDGGIFRHYLRDAKGNWRQLTDWADEVQSVTFGPNDDLWLISRKDAPRGKVLRLPGNAKALTQAKVVIAEGKDSIITDFFAEWGVTATKDQLLVSYQTGGPSELRAFSLTGKAGKPIATPPVSSVSQPVIVGGDVLLYAVSFTTPGAWYRVRKGAVSEIAALSEKPPVDLSDFEVRRELATSKDGTPVPLNIVWKKDAPLDGSTPCVVTGYGGYGVNEEPFFPADGSVLLKRGVCFVSTNLRGGGEFGEEWHRNGMLTRKQNVFDDFAAVLGYLAEKGYSSADKLIIQGGSNGGLLMGAMLTQHPELMHAVVSHVGVYDMLRVELSANGQFNVTEYGSTTDPEQFAALSAYSPYHNVKKGTKYPATLMLTGANDPRVEPWHSRKMVAALQWAQGGDAPILLRTSKSSGHGQGTSKSERIEQTAQVFAWILSQAK